MVEGGSRLALILLFPSTKSEVNTKFAQNIYFRPETTTRKDGIAAEAAGSGPKEGIQDDDTEADSNSGRIYYWNGHTDID